jgi:hypothetical protein
MPLTDDQRAILAEAGTTPDLTKRRRAVAIYLDSTGEDLAAARALLAQSYSRALQPSFHLVPYGDKMASETAFTESYEHLARATDGFRTITRDTLLDAVTSRPSSLAPLRMILSLTRNELAFTMHLAHPELSVTDTTLRKFEQRSEPADDNRGHRLATIIVEVALGIMNGTLLTVPPPARSVFHSKLDHFDTRHGWSGVSAAALAGVPYSALLYQRYVGGTWRQAQDTYSEVKGDAVLELPLRQWLDARGIPYYHSPAGATGAAQTATRFHLSPGPDFVLPPSSPTVVLECKVGEDGGTVRDKAARVKNLAEAARQRGLAACALIDGKGWEQRASALVEVVVATEGRTYTLQTLDYLLEVPEIRSLATTRD